MSEQKKEVKNEKKKFKLENIILSLWGVVLAFTVQVLYDTFGTPFYTSIMPKNYWGLGIALGLSVLLLFYIKRLRKPEK